ncbi:DUF551 domain-containing protein [Enterobacter asburiae]|uniref:DUF551 domain-containing protein n=1 Tax=Enterobacter asburiae TaxID=61645 RepID=UPI0031660683
MSTITKELAKLFRKITNSEIDAEGNAHVVLSPADSLLINNARIALASLEAEPVAFVMADDLKDSSIISTPAYRDLGEARERTVGDVVALFTAPPAPVSVPDEIEPTVEAIKRVLPTSNPDEYAACIGADMWNACRAAMLQGAVQQQNQQQNIPENIPVNTPCKEAPEHIWLQTAGVWPENGEFSELTWCSDNQHEDDTLYVRADVVPGNSPVIPDGWKLVPIDPTKDMLRAGQSVVGFWLNTVHCYSKMLAAAPAAPQQEVTQALAKGMERYGDAMQKLADSGD